MENNRIDSFAFVLQDEGSAIQRDRDQPTVWGLMKDDIWQATGKHLIAADLVEYSQEEAKIVYEYLWRKYQMGLLPTGLDYFMFDSGLVCSYPTVYRWLSLSLGFGDPEPSIKQLVEVSRGLSQERVGLLIAQMCFSRRRRHKAQAGWLRHRQQWTNRVNRVQRRALAMCYRFQTTELARATA